MTDQNATKGSDVVLGCPRNKMARYEIFLWEHRWQILKYFELRGKRKRINAERKANEAQEIVGRSLTARSELARAEAMLDEEGKFDV